MLKDFDPNRIEDPEMRQQALALLNLLLMALGLVPLRARLSGAAVMAGSH